jgi:hypothetical protein
MVAEIRHEEPPTAFYDPKKADRLAKRQAEAGGQPPAGSSS